MKLKGQSATEFFCDHDGKIVIQQFDPFLKKYRNVYLSLEQFEFISNWIGENRQKIVELWNCGLQRDQSEEAENG